MVAITHNLNAPAFAKDLGKFIQDATIRVAEQALREEVGKGFDASPVVVTDGTVRRDYHQVRIGGKIEFISRTNMAAVVMWAMNELWKLSPIRTRRYLNSHVILINGQSVGNRPAEALAKVKSTDRVQIVNPQPYAKKIEGRKASLKRGVAGFKGLSKQAPNGVYQLVLKRLVQVYGKSMFFDFKYVKLSSGVKVWGVAGGSKTITPRVAQRATNGRFVGLSHQNRIQRDAVYPALQFYIKPTERPN